MTKMNKAQRDLIFKTGDDLFNAKTYTNEDFRQSVWEFAVKFVEIDPMPDVDVYYLHRKSSQADRNDFSWFSESGSKLEAERKLLELFEIITSKAIVEYKHGEYLVTFYGDRYEIRKEE